MDLYSAHTRSMASVQRLMGATCPVFTWNDADRNIIPGSAMLRKDLSPGGFSLDADLQFHVLISDLIDDPNTQTADSVKADLLVTEMVYLSEDFKIVSVSTLPGNQIFEIKANSLNQGA